MSRCGRCSSLLLAARVGRKLVYVGRLEWGLSRRLVAELRDRCTVLSGPVCEGAERSRGVVWIHPEFTAEVQYNELMQGRLRGLALRAVRYPRP